MVQYKSVNFKQFSLIDREAFLKSITTENAEPQVMLCTCNRVEQYFGSGEVSADIVHYLFRLVSGLESSFIGETAIQGQIKTAYQDAASKYKLSSTLHKLFQNALRVGKKVRTESGISLGAMSHSQATIEILKRENIDFESSIITLIGVNKLNEGIIRFLNSKKAYSIFLSNRSYNRAEELATKYNCSAFKLDARTEILSVSDVLISATSAPHLIIKPEHITPGKKILILDLAFPRDVDESIASMPNVTLYNLEDLRIKIDENVASRQSKVKLAHEIIDEEVEKFCSKNNIFSFSQF